jgi:hypothetical protein
MTCGRSLKKAAIFYWLFFLMQGAFSQSSYLGQVEWDEVERRRELLMPAAAYSGVLLRSIKGTPDLLKASKDSTEAKELLEFRFLPVYLYTKLDGKRPSPGGVYGMIPARGAQGYLSTGVQARFSLLHIQLQPEFVAAQNLSFPGFSDTFSKGTIADRFRFWNVGDMPERFGNEMYRKVYWGQSSISLRYGAFELGAGTKNFWWGPGQWNSLIFSNNAPGFPHVSLNTTKPAKTFLGAFEGQVLIGRLESSNQAPTQVESLNKQFFRPLNPDWRYLNGLMLSYSPKWLPALSAGYTRTFQYYNADRPNDLFGWLPILEPMAKESFIQDGTFVEYDGRRQSQQISVFGRYKFTKAKAEIYLQYGRRDHALDWREFILNPEHARAYQLGFLKVHPLVASNKYLQVRGEITQQQESINRILRYGKQGGSSWHTHGQLRGFTNYGQPMGVGIGTGSNVQTLEVAVVEDWHKLGILLERLENHQDFYFRAFGQQKERKPWIDWTAAVVWNTSYKNLLVAVRLQGTYARNYQWGLSETSTPEFPVSQDLFSVHSQVNLIYFWKGQE